MISNKKFAWTALALAFILASFAACASKDKDSANKRLTEARAYYQLGDYEKAKETIDSISVLFPKSFVERKQSLELLDSVRRAFDLLVLERCDSIILVLEPELEEMKKLFVFKKDKEYQDFGNYYPKRRG